MDFDALLLRVGENLRRARWIAGLTQEDVAALGITYRYYQELERGQRNPTLRILHHLADTLGTTVGALCGTDPAASRAAERNAGVRLGPPRRGRKPSARKRRPKP